MAGGEGVARTRAVATRKRLRRAHRPRSRTAEDEDEDDEDEYEYEDKYGHEDAHAHGKEDEGLVRARRNRGSLTHLAQHGHEPHQQGLGFGLLLTVDEGFHVQDVDDGAALHG